MIVLGVFIDLVNDLSLLVANFPYFLRMELGLTTKFVNHWQTLIDQGKRHLEEKLIVDISGDEITLKNGEKHSLYDWQRGKTIEELNRRTIEFYTTSIKSYEDSIKREDGE